MGGTGVVTIGGILGMAAHLDAIGNVCGRYEGDRPGLPCLMLGSHYDTVRDAGKWDGPLGVITAIACVAELNRRDWDSLIDRLAPELVTIDSPTQRVGAPLDGRLPKVQHLTAKESLQDAFSYAELEEWIDQMRRSLGDDTKEFEIVCELKIDGLNIF